MGVRSSRVTESLIEKRFSCSEVFIDIYILQSFVFIGGMFSKNR